MTPLEASLGSAFISLVTALAVRLFMADSFVTKRECQQRHERECQSVASITRKIDRLSSMIGTLVLHSDLPQEQKDELLNQRGDS
ncbi:hypothetical protein LWC08_05195 [Desulfobaculum bizertense]|uniref:hypothetical protein n=1 Tax=Desulfobaculum bizertense TaxID=376490 RepID=UPI001F35AB2C|nr:hypothetical protein [Desulfobaculum bizertense]UIJ38514.1 hypothetical protein LWC08_02805 [Desulfobaculum bizertense]UIJ38971.1 hypothetical protein LWC08_05195 [Desulfobaculum bizertense]